MNANRLRQVLRYDSRSGEFLWKVRAADRIHIGDLAGSVNKSGYRVVQIDGQKYKGHQLAWLYVYGEWPTGGLDHRNGKRADNRIANLRLATDAQNAQNQHRAKRTNRTGLLGVCPSRDRWRASIMVGGKRTNLGQFDSPEEAHAAYLAAKAELHPFHDAATTS